MKNSQKLFLSDLSDDFVIENKTVSFVFFFFFNVVGMDDRYVSSFWNEPTALAGSFTILQADFSRVRNGATLERSPAENVSRLLNTVTVSSRSIHAGE